MDNILQVHSHTPLTTLPHLTFYIEISVECSFERQVARNDERDYFEKEKIEFYQKLNKGYQLIADSARDRVKIINGEQDINKIHQDIYDQTNSFIKARKN